MFTTGQRVMFKEVPLRVIGTKRDGMIVCEDDNGDETTFTADQLRGECQSVIIADDPVQANQTPAQMQQATAWFNKTMGVVGKAGKPHTKEDAGYFLGVDWAESQGKQCKRQAYGNGGSPSPRSCEICGFGPCTQNDQNL
mgnify:CR=1 FL=1